jgi:hypothetical protein
VNDELTLSIEHKGEQKDYQARLVQFGYSYRIVVTVNDVGIYFEPDEERNFRIVAIPEQDEKLLRKIDKNVLSLLKEKLEEVLM